ncbi:uncharacterized protein LOC111467980, partial [Cucurbita maxima]|uniref:Uncharacterized protein LOC111467980 n=1 Tax=Cucurbita maxima TaxID=3661 RepID=A0A6J1I0U4_CUCMA
FLSLLGFPFVLCIRVSLDESPSSSSSSSSNQSADGVWELRLSRSVDSSSCSFTRKTAVVLLCAAKIASASMGKAVIVARADAERKVREVAVARKRAREALEHVGFLLARERARRKEEASMEVSGSGNMEMKDKERNRNLGSMVKTENSLEAPAVPTLNTATALTQRRESLNGFVRQMSMVKNEAAASVQETAEADRLQINNNIASSEKEKSGNFADNEDAENVQNDHKIAL